MTKTDTQTVEPAGWRYRLKGGKWTVQKNKPYWYKDGSQNVELEPLYAERTRLNDVLGWVTVRVEDTGDGLIINSDDAKEWGLKDDQPYEGSFLPDGTYRIAIPYPTADRQKTHIDLSAMTDRQLDELQEAIDKAPARVLELCPTAADEQELWHFWNEKALKLVREKVALLAALKEAVEFANKANNYIAGQDLPASAEWLAVIAKAEGRDNG